MSHSKNDPVLDRLKDKVRMVEKSGQFNTVHHENLKNYLASLKPAPKYTPGKDDVKGDNSNE